MLVFLYIWCLVLVPLSFCHSLSPTSFTLKGQGFLAVPDNSACFGLGQHQRLTLLCGFSCCTGHTSCFLFLSASLREPVTCPLSRFVYLLLDLPSCRVFNKLTFIDLSTLCFSLLHFGSGLWLDSPVHYSSHAYSEEPL